jgi:hypothetical protein
MLLAAVLRWLADLLVLAVLSALAILFRNGEMLPIRRMA